jgi:hypothetical protein
MRFRSSLPIIHQGRRLGVEASIVPSGDRVAVYPVSMESPSSASSLPLKARSWSSGSASLDEAPRSVASGTSPRRRRRRGKRRSEDQDDEDFAAPSLPISSASLRRVGLVLLGGCLLFSYDLWYLMAYIERLEPGEEGYGVDTMGLPIVPRARPMPLLNPAMLRSRTVPESDPFSSIESNNTIP